MTSNSHIENNSDFIVYYKYSLMHMKQRKPILPLEDLTDYWYKEICLKLNSVSQLLVSDRVQCTSQYALLKPKHSLPQTLEHYSSISYILVN